MNSDGGHRTATAFVPGHITGFFSVHPADDPRQAGSRGAGLALTDGVTVRVSPGSGVRLNNELIEIDPVETVCQKLGVTAAVEAETPLPLGAGFGVSGAVTLGTALAANMAFDCQRTENELGTIAHCAEVDAGTGLGDVVAQARGGIPIRTEPGAAGYGTLDGLTGRPRIEYLTLGELSTEAILTGDTDQLSDAGETALDRLLTKPTIEQFMSVSRQFAHDAGVLTDEVERAMAKAEATGGQAAMAMLGRTVFGTDTALSDAGYEPRVCGIDAAGSRLQPVGAADSAEKRTF